MKEKALEASPRNGLSLPSCKAPIEYQGCVELQYHVSDWRSKENLVHDYGNNSPRYSVRTTMPSLCTIVNFLGSQSQDKHNASFFLNMSWRELPLSNCKNNKILINSHIKALHFLYQR